MFKKIKKIEDVVSWRLCNGCGACVYACKNNAIKLKNITELGIRPIVNTNCRDCGECLKICSGYYNRSCCRVNTKDSDPDYLPHWGPILEIFEGYATDDKIRHFGSSGGIVTALSLYCIEHENADGIIHINTDKNNPLQNCTAFSSTREKIIAATGSRYSPASPCDNLYRFQSSKNGAVMVGKGCDISALRNAQNMDPIIDDKTKCAIGIFCAGTPAALGTVDLLNSYGIPINRVREIRYRGMGWPGNFAVKKETETEFRSYATYQDSWGIAQRYRPFRCYLCPDGTAETADISCGDSWYRKPEKNNQGHSLILVRTERGRRIIQGAIDKNYIAVTRTTLKALELSQVNLKAKRGEIAGRMLMLNLAGIPTPKYHGWPLWKNWWKTGIKEKARSLASTVKRILSRRLYKKDTMFFYKENL
ncbi:Coenzyme F420 hydrogenase/dehydrogenase, beta subunit [Chitinispirillum alkaliphilum]|nr:Coenzyme F420 hydrogenase/dehydrogenase, beta subunit [Chitinispirillum alkaliphilum]